MELISEGKFVLVQRGDQDKIIQFKTDEKLRFGKGSGEQEIDISNAANAPYYSAFKIIPNYEPDSTTSKKSSKRSFSIERVDEILGGKIFNYEGTGSGKDNRFITDDNKSQTLLSTEIAILREKGVSGREILDTLITQSKTFGQKTEFSQEKYLKKKERAYGDTLIFIKPTIGIIADYYYKKDPAKILNLRPDSLAQLLCYANVHSGGKFLVYETGCSGLLISAVLQRLNAHGICLHVHTGSTPQRQAVFWMNFSSDELSSLKSLDVFYIIRPNQFQISDEGPVSKKQKIQESENNEKIDKYKKETKELCTINRAQNEASEKLLRETQFDGLIICGKEHPLSILQNLLPSLAPSAPFAIFCPYSQPLEDCFIWLKESSSGVNLNIFENWFRNIQVQPERTHPEINMSSSGGFILQGTKIIN